MEQMLDEVCGYLRNWFLVKPNGIHHGEYEIKDGTFTCDFLQNGQYFRIVHSVFNDGVHKYQASDLVDETFTGEIWAMAVPPAVIALVSEIAEWQAKYGGASSPAMSPYSSESFNNYSYTRASRSSIASGGGGSSDGWNSVYASRLTRWRKL